MYQVVLRKSFSHCQVRSVSAAAPAKVLKATVDFLDTYQAELTPGPISFLKKASPKIGYALLKGFVEAPPAYFQMIENVAYLWMNEICRAIIDRHSENTEVKKYYDMAKGIASKIFGVRLKIFNTEPRVPQFFYGAPENDIAYTEIPDERKLTQILQETIQEYNKLKPYERISVIIFNSIIEKTIKVNRAVHQPNSNTILIAETGAGGPEICKMAIRLAKKKEFSLFAKDGSYAEDICMPLR